MEDSEASSSKINGQKEKENEDELFIDSQVSI